MNRGASFSASDGTLFFGGVDGAVSFSGEQENTTIPKPIPRVIAYYEFSNLKKTDTLLPYSNSIVIAPGVKYFSLEVTGSVLFLDEQDQFQYKVNGLHDDWVNLDGNRRISFNNVKPDTYDLGVKVGNSASSEVINPNVVQLIVQPTFWQTDFAKILIGACAIGMIFLIVFLWTNYLRRQRIVLNKLVEERTAQLSESELHLKMANETKDRFFSILAHDLKSPFSALLGLSELIAGYWEDYTDGEKKKMAGSMHLTVNSLYRLLTNLLEWSRLQRGVIKPERISIALKEVIEEVIESQQITLNSKRISVILNVSDTQHVFGDLKMTETVLRNLISNAIKFSDEGSSIEIFTGNDSKGIKVTVKDFGTGIQHDKQKALFDSIETISTVGTRGEKGTGLGLQLCNEFIHKMGGEIGLKSAPGQGSEFWFILPAVK